MDISQLPESLQLPGFPSHLKILETRFIELHNLYFTAMEMGIDIHQQEPFAEEIETVRRKIGTHKPQTDWA